MCTETVVPGLIVGKYQRVSKNVAGIGKYF